MGHKVNPLGLRLNLTRAWESVWYFGKKDYGKTFCEDMMIRKYLLEKLSKAAIKNIMIDRSAKKVTVNIYSAKLGLVIGKQGADIKDIKDHLTAMVGLEVVINTFEVKNPDLLAGLVAQSIAKQMEARQNYKRAMKRAMRAAMSTGALGIKICCGGRLGGVEIARKEWYREGSIPLHTLRANIDYGYATAFTTYGCCGVKVWICRPQESDALKTKTDSAIRQDYQAYSFSEDGAEVIDAGRKAKKVDKATGDSAADKEFFISPLSERKMRDMEKAASSKSNLKSTKSAETGTKPKTHAQDQKKVNAAPKGKSVNGTSVVDKGNIEAQNKANSIVSRKSSVVVELNKTKKDE